MLSFEAPSTSSLAINHDNPLQAYWHTAPLQQTAVANAVNELLGQTREYTVQPGDTIASIEGALGVYIGQNLISGVKHLVGQTLRVKGSQLIFPSGTTFTAGQLAANDEMYQQAA